MGQLFDIIQRHIDAQPYGVSQAKVADAMGVSRTTIGNLRNPDGLVAKQTLQAIARVTGTPYIEVLNALLHDIGYDSDDEGSSSPGGSHGVAQAPVE